MLSWLQQYLDSAKMTEAGPLDLLDVDSDSDKEDLSLPGVLKGGRLISNIPAIVITYWTHIRWHEL